MLKNIGEIKKIITTKIIILGIVLIIFIFLTLFSHYFKRIELLDTYSIIICGFLIINFINSLTNLYEVTRIQKNPFLKDELNSILLNLTGCYILTNNYIVSYSDGQLIKYKDIVLIYHKDAVGIESSRKRIYIIHKSVQNSKSEPITSIISTGSHIIPKNFLNIILDKNPNILIGLTNENKKIIYDKYNIKL